MAKENKEQEKKKVSVWKEITQPFVDLVHAPRVLFGINLAYVLEGTVYFGMLGYLAIYFSGFVFGGMEKADELSHTMVMVLTAGITISMFFLGSLADKLGVRRALMTALALMLAGRVLISSAPTIFGLQPDGLWSSLHVVTMLGILLVVIGYGMYQPAAYAGVRKFTTKATAAMGFAMLYALMNLGAWLPTFAFLARDDDYLGMGITGTYWIYTAFTVVALVATGLILTRKVVERAMVKAKATREEEGEEEANTKKIVEVTHDSGPAKIPFHMYLVWVAIVGVAMWRIPGVWGYRISVLLAVLPFFIFVALPNARWQKMVRWVAEHPLSNLKFFFFIFALIPVQTLFTYNWLVLPQYISRAFDGWIGDYFEIASNANPILIFILVPIITALTMKAKVYNMMILGTFIMAAPAFFLSFGPTPLALGGYILLMTIGEAMWQPRFLQYAAEIAPENKVGQYMGVAQLPWFLTKVLVPLLYSGQMMERYCPEKGMQSTGTMWFWFGCIAISSSVMLILAKKWVSKSMNKS